MQLIIRDLIYRSPLDLYQGHINNKEVNKIPMREIGQGTVYNN